MEDLWYIIHVPQRVHVFEGSETVSTGETQNVTRTPRSPLSPEPIHYCNKILLSDWLSAGLILAL